MLKNTIDDELLNVGMFEERKLKQMIGILLVAHGEIGAALYNSASKILGKEPEDIGYISINSNDDINHYEKIIGNPKHIQTFVVKAKLLCICHHLLSLKLVQALIFCLKAVG